MPRSWLIAFGAALSCLAPAQDFLWIKQVEAPSILAMAVDSTGVYIGGLVSGALPGQTSAGSIDAYVRKYDSNGNEIWTRQFGTEMSDRVQGAAAHDGAVYLAGSTGGVFLGQTGAGGRDAFVRKYDANGNHLWTHQFGTSGYDLGLTVAANSMGVFVFGRTNGVFAGQPSSGAYDAFLAKFGLDGEMVWIHQIETGTPSPRGFGGVGVDDSGVYLADTVVLAFPGQTSAGGWDGFLRKYDFNGAVQWTRQFGTACGDYVTAITAGTAGLYVTGSTNGDFNDPSRCTAAPQGASQTGFIRKYSADGNVSWARQIKVSRWANGFDSPEVIAADGSAVYLGGLDQGTMPGQSPEADESDHSVCAYPHRDHFVDTADAYVRSYDSHGSALWTRQFGGVFADAVHAIGLDSNGVYAGGFATCLLPGQPGGNIGASFLIKLSRTPVTVLGKIQLIVGQVETLRDSGVLSTGNARALIESLEAGLDRLNRGDTAGCKTQLQTFIQKVSAHARSGALTASQAQNLIDSASAVIGQL
jgi:hypothetical protein